MTYNSLTLTPAYGRDYKSKAKLMADWEAGKDFLVTDMHSPDNGRYLNLPDLKQYGGVTHLHFRYNKLTQVHVVKL